MRHLATVQVIKDLRPIEGADRIEYASVLGWGVVTQKGNFKVGDLCVYFEVDSLLPEDNEYFEFLKNSKGQIKRLRTMKIRGMLSQGLIMPLEILNPKIENYGGIKIPFIMTGWDDRSVVADSGIDVTSILNVKKYEVPEVHTKYGFKTGHGTPFPPFLFKTDEPRIQGTPNIIEELRDRPYVITIKEDGTSATFFLKDGEFGVCSRNRQIKLKEDYESVYWDIAEKYKIEECMRDSSNKTPEWGYAIQGEITGPGIRNNRLGLDERRLALFNMFDITNCQYLSDNVLQLFAIAEDIPIVETLERGDNFNYTMEELIELATTVTYPNGQPAEGIVIRPAIEIKSEALKGDRLSFKVINNEYLIEHKI